MRAPLRVRPTRFLLAAAGIATSFAVAHVLLRGRLLASWRGEEALAPLYAFVEPVLRPQALVFAALAVVAALLAPKLADPERTPRARFAAALAALAILLPLALHLVRAPLAELGANLDLYRNEEFLHDARRIEDAAGFLDRYVELMPTLSLHGRHFPPGHALLLHLNARILGPGALAAGVLVLAFAAAGVLLAWRALEALVPERAARQGALLLLGAPALLDFACTSMDAVFLAFAALAWLLSIAAVVRGGAPRAWLAGAALGLALLFSFSALPLGLWVLLLALLRGRAAALPHVLAGFAAFVLLLFAATGFPVWACFLRAVELNAELMRGAAGGSLAAIWAPVSIGNAAAFLAGAGIALAAALSAREPASLATLLALLAMAFGGLHFLETERIWLYALPWLAATAVAAGPFDDRSLRTLLALGLAQALLLETSLFTLW